ncbi:MAG: hypothetical protein V4507_00105 [Verrucomicrobiota bacterium]
MNSSTAHRFLLHKWFSLVCLIALFSLIRLPAEDGPIFELKIEKEKISDISAAAREINSKVFPFQDEKTGKTFVRLDRPDSITIPYLKEDPFFKSGPFTWILVGNLETYNKGPSPRQLAGRWDATTDGRYASITFVKEANQLNLNLSPDGKQIYQTRMVQNLEIHEETILVAYYSPEVGASIQMRDKKGTILCEANIKKSLPCLSESSAPFSFNGNKDSWSFNLSHFIAWNRALNDTEIISILTALK